MTIIDANGSEHEVIRRFRNGEARYAEAYLPAGDGWLAVFRFGDGPGIFIERIIAWEQQVSLTLAGQGLVDESREIIPVIWSGWLEGMDDALAVVHEKDLTAERRQELEREGAESWERDKEAKARKAQEPTK